MKRMILLALCAGSTTLAMAHPATYFQINAGVYAGRQLMKPTSGFDFDYGPGYKLGLAAGVTKHRWRVELGVGVLTMMASKKMLVYFGDITDPKTGKIVTEPIDTKFTERYQHIIVPLTVGFRLAESRKMTLNLFAGAAVSNNFACDRKAEGEFLDGEWRRMSFSGSKLVKWSIWGNAGVEAGYRLGRQTQLTLSPEIWYMFSSFKSDRRIAQHPLAAGINLSFRYFLQ